MKNLTSKFQTIYLVVVKAKGSQLPSITSRDYKNKSLNDKDSMSFLHVGSSRREIEKT